MRIALAGATGLIGHAIAARLAAEGHEVLSIGRGADASIRLDLARDRALAPGALRGCDALVHAAGVTDGDFADREAAFDKALFGAQALVETARDAGLRRLAYVSSAHVYGPLEGTIDESRAPDPRSDYAIAHYATEQVFRRAAGGGRAVLLARPCAVYGMPPSLERFARWTLIPFDFPRQALTGRIVLASSGEQRRNFVSAEGVARLVGEWLASEAAGTTVANAPGPDEMSVFEFARLCARIAAGETGREPAIERPAPAGAGGEPFAYRTRVGSPLAGPALEDHARALIRALSRKAP